MKKILYVTGKGNIEIKYPEYLEPIMKTVWRELKVHIVKAPANNSHIKGIYIDEAVNVTEKQWKLLDNLLTPTTRGTGGKV